MRGKDMIRRSLAVLGGAALLASLSTQVSAEVTYTKDVAPILQKHCQNCHRPGEGVPMTLLTYEEVRPWARSVKKVVADGTMPPWHADPAIGHWKNDRRMAPEEISTVVAWVDGGAVMGDPKDHPAPLHFSEGWKIGTPDVVFTFEQDEILPPELQDEYHYVSMKTNFTEDRWVKAVECRPGNMEVVHHIIAFAKPGNMSMEEGKDQNGAEGEGTGRRGRGRGRGGVDSISALGGMAPGTDPRVLANGDGIMIPAGSDIVFQMHYHKEAGKEERDRSSIGLIFCDYPVKKQHHGDAVSNFMFNIPPNNDNYEVKGMMVLDQDIDLRSVMPHMHLRGKDMRVWAVTPDGTSTDLIWVPKYDFNWQTIYEFADPLRLPKGTKLHAVAHYNNSTSNPFNPDPNDTVRFGEPTTAEMMFAFLGYTLPNENLNVYDPSAAPKSGGAQ